MNDWTLFEALLVGGGMFLFSLVVGSAYYLCNFIVQSIRERRELKIIRPRNTEYVDYDRAWEEMVMKD